MRAFEAEIEVAHRRRVKTTVGAVGRLERPQFYALFGDFETGINEPELTRYQRSMNGVKAEYRGENLAATAFVADTPYRYRRDELQGNGLSGPYQLGARDILANSERISIEVRDRLRSNIVVDSRTLTLVTRSLLARMSRAPS